jgi:hypothetical protein
MKKELLIVLLSILTTVSFSQDVLLFQDGSKKDAKILEISPEIVKYKKYNSSSDVIYTEDKYNLIGVVFEDGEFEKFEGKKNTFSKNMSSKLGEYGSNMFYVGPLDLLYGFMLNIGYEHFTKSGRSSIRLPIRLQLGDSYTDPIGGSSIYNFWKIGFEHKFFPTGSSGTVRGFLGYGVHFGGYTYNSYYTSYDYYGDGYSYYERRGSIFYNAQFIGGIQFQPIELINITMDVGIGPAVDSDDFVLWPSFSTTIGFRF